MTHTIRPSMIGQNPAHFAITIALVPLLIGIPILALWMLDVDLTRIRIGDGKLSVRKGIIRHRLTEIDLDQIGDIRIAQSRLQRLVGSGDLHVFDRQDQWVATVLGVKEPERIKQLALI
ncbi:PH domain-containing protein [Ruegeria atlantica]|uniref:PH domain-containing protein n=1 Tax=Ruegeria atlantica TaxID=81569 RepID=UPI002494430C|nr:PH domain-containing protein [Ruegeria atlantica]